MPRLPSSCRTIGCPNIVEKRGACDDCERERNHARLPDKRIYGRRQHKEWAAAVLARDRICRMCGSRRSVIADHVLPLRQGGSWDLDNGQGLCRPCDGAKGVNERFIRG